MNAYGFVAELRENVLKVGQEKIKLCMVKITGSANHSIKQVALVEEKVNRSGQEEPYLLQVEMEEELAEEIQISVMRKEVFGKPTMGVETKFLLVPELIEAAVAKSLKMRLRKRLLTRTKQTWISQWCLGHQYMTQWE